MPIVAPSPDDLNVIISYTDREGNTRDRLIRPLVMVWESIAEYPEPQFLLMAMDLENEDDEGNATPLIKHFAFSGIDNWRSASGK